MARILLRDLTPGTAYELQFRANSGDDVSEWSQKFSLVTDADTTSPDVPAWAPTSALVADGTSFIATWQPLNFTLNQNKDFSHYEIELSAAGKTFVIKTSNTFYVLSFEENLNLFGTVTPVINARLRSVDDTGNASAWGTSNQATNPPPAAPSSITGSAAVDQIGLTWTASTDDDVIGYRVYTGSTAGFTPAPGNKIFEGNALNYSYTTTTYSGQWFKVVAVDVFGQESTTPTATASATTPTSPFVSDTTPPAAPAWGTTTLANNANGLAAVATLAWTQTLPNPNDLGGFEIRYREGAAAWTAAGTWPSDALSAVVEVPKAYTAYEFNIRSFDQSRNYSAWVARTISAVANTRPADVTGVVSTPGRQSMTYRWTAVADTDLSYYEVTFSTNATFGDGDDLTFRTGTSATLTVNGLTPGTTYYARVRAVDNGGLTSLNWSATDTKATLGQITPGDIGAPTLDQFGNLQIKVDDSIKTYVEEFYLSTSESTQTGGTWSTTPPTRTPGTFIWTRTLLTYQDNSTNTTPAVLLTGNTGATGANGTPASIVELTANTQVLTSPAAGGATTPATATITGTATNTTIADANSLTSGWSYSADGAAFSITPPAGLSRTGNTVTITGSTMTAKTIAVKAIGVSGVADTLTVAKVANGAAGTDGTDGTDGTNGADGYTVILTNEAQVFAGTTTTAVADSTKSTSVIAYKGATQRTTSVTQANITGLPTGMTAAVTNNGTTNTTITFTVTTAMTSASGAVTIPVVIDGITFNKIFSYSISFKGTDGAAGVDATTVDVGNDAIAIPVTAAGAATAAGSITIPFTAFIGTNRAAATISYSALPAGITLGSNTAGTTGAAGSLVLNYANGATIGSADVSNVTLTVTANSQTFTHIFSISRAYTGAQGGTGGAGTSATSIDVSPDVFVVPTNNAGAASATSSATVNVRGFVGSTASNVTALSVTSGLPAGVTATPTTGASANIVFNWTSGATIGASAGGNIVCSATVNGIVFTVNIGWARALGGSNGANGRGVTSITPYYARVTAGSPPTQPPNGTVTPAAPWQTTEPDYLAGTELYRTEKVLYTDSTIEYTTQVKSSSYTASATAMTTANGKNKIIFSTSDATGTTGYVDGDTWFKRDGSGIIIGQWEFVSGAWAVRTVGSAVIANLNVGKLVSGDIATALIKITNSGSIQSSDYSSTLGWSLGPTGLIMNKGSVKAETLIGGVLTSTTGIIDIGAGASIRLNGGHLRSNTYGSATYNVNATAGWYFDDTNLHIPDGNISAKALKTSTLSAATITLGASGVIQGGNGWSLSNTGLTIPNGGIKAASLDITTAGKNIVPNSGFEDPVSPTYSWSATGTFTPTIDTTIKRSGAESIKLVGTAAQAGADHFYVNNTGFVPVPNTKYTASAWVYVTAITAGAVGNRGILVFDGQNSAATTTLGTGHALNTWVRHVCTFTSGAAPSAITMRLYAPHGTVYWDEVQVEEGDLASAYSVADGESTNYTRISGDSIITGAIRSTNQVSVNGINEWQWEIKKDGVATFTAMRVLGNTVIGNGPTDSASLLSSSNFAPGETGWQFRADGTADLRGLAADTLSGRSIKAGTLSLNTVDSLDPLANSITIGNSGSLVAMNATTKASVAISGTEGFVVRGPIAAGATQGPLFINFPINPDADGNTAPNIISGVLTATTLSVTGDANDNAATFFGNNFLELNANITLRNQIAAASAAPTVANTYSYTAANTASGHTLLTALYPQSATQYVGITKTGSNASAQYWLVTFNASGTPTTTSQLTGMPTTRNAAQITVVDRAFKNLVLIGTTWYAMGYEVCTGTSGDVYSAAAYYSFNSTGAYQSGSMTAFGGQGVGQTWANARALGTDGTGLLLAYKDSSTHTVQTMSTAFVLTGSPVTISPVPAGTVMSVHGTSADFGSAHWVIATNNASDNVQVVTTAGAASNHPFPAGSYALRGIYYSTGDGRFIGTSSAAISEVGKIGTIKYSGITWTTETSRWGVAVTRYDSTGNFETPASDVTYFTAVKRAWIQVTSDAGQSPQQRVYFGRKASGDLANSELFRQSALLIGPAGVTGGIQSNAYSTATLSGSNPQAGANSYPSNSAASGRVSSQAVEVLTTGFGTTAGSTAATGTGFRPVMVGAKIESSGQIPAGTTIVAVNSATSITLSQNATVTNGAGIADVTLPLIDLKGSGYARIKDLFSDAATLASGTVASTASGNKPALRIGNVFGPHLRVSDDRLIAMDSDTAQGTLYLNDGGTTYSTRMILQSTTDAAITANNAPALRVGDITALHLRIDGNEIIAMNSNTAQGTLTLNAGGTTNIATLNTNVITNSGSIDFTPSNGALTISGASNIRGKLRATNDAGAALTFIGAAAGITSATANPVSFGAGNTATLHALDIHSWSGGLFMEDLSGGGTTGATIGNGGRIVRTSTIKYKENINEMTHEEAHSVLGLKSYTFNFKESFDGPDPRTYPGFIAEQAAEVGAELWVGRQHKVTYDENGNKTVERDENGEVIYFRTGDITVAHNVLIKELHEEKEALQERVARLEAAVEELLAR